MKEDRSQALEEDRDEDESQLKSKADRGSERKQDGIEPAECIDGMGGMMQQAQEKGSR